MTPQERDVIAGIFERLKGAANQQRDPEAERFIAELVQKQPYATYALAQAVFVQEQALTNAQQTIEQLQFQLQEAQARPQQGGFLSGLFGGGQRPAPAQNYRPQQGMPGPQGMHPQGMPMAGGMNNPGMNAGPWGGAQQGGPWGQQQQPQGGGFLRTAAMTAAGVAGGMVVGNMLMNAFSGSGAAHAADAAHGVMPLNQDVASALGSSAPSQPAAHEASHNEQFDSQADYGYDSGDDESYDV